MQCTSCQFQNMPGVETCGRCGAVLRLVSTAVDVHPPRAGRRRKHWRRGFPLHRLSYGLRDSLLGHLERWLGAFDLQRPSPGVFLRMVVPGWPQVYAGRRRLGWAMLGSYLALLLAGLVFVGTLLGSLLLGLALSVHASSVLDVIIPCTRDWRLRIGCAAVCFLALALVVYLPAGWSITRVAAPRRITEMQAPLQAGDVFIYNQSAYFWSPPKPGDVVLYEFPHFRLNARRGGQAVVYQLQGERIDRVLAGPGQEVACAGGKLLVNGRPAPWLPLNPEALPENLTLTVPADHYFVLPSTDTMLPASNLRLLRRAGVVRAENVLGKVYLRSQPLWRFWVVR
jgi:signal peptidase I